MTDSSTPRRTDAGRNLYVGGNGGFRPSHDARPLAAPAVPRVTGRGRQRPATASELRDGRVLRTGALLPVRRSGDG